MMELNELEPCPYCWHYKGECITPDITFIGGAFWAMCPACLYSVAEDTRASVISKWNRNAHIPRGEDD